MSDHARSNGYTRRRALGLAGRGALATTAAVAGLLTVYQTPAAAAQSNWKFCRRCCGLWFSGNNTRGGCPAGNLFDGGHHLDGSGNYVLKVQADGGAGQDGWRWCAQCQGLYFGLNAGQGICPADASLTPGPGHYPISNPSFGVFINSALFRIEDVDHRDGPGGQSQWRWCVKCAGLYFDGNSPGASGVCPADHRNHSRAGSGDYVLRQL